VLRAVLPTPLPQTLNTEELPHTQREGQGVIDAPDTGVTVCMRCPPGLPAGSALPSGKRKGAITPHQKHCFMAKVSGHEANQSIFILQ